MARPAADTNKSALRRLSKRSPAERRRQETLFRLVAPYALAAVELGWWPPGFVGPGVRLEYLRLFNGKDIKDWPTSAGITKHAYQNWRSDRPFPAGFDEKGAKARLGLCRLLAVLPQSAEFAWVLGGSGLNRPALTLEQRADMLRVVAQGVRKAGDPSVAQIHQSLWSTATDTSTLKPKAPTPPRAATIKALAQISAPWSTQRWLQTGVAHPPTTIRDLADRMNAMIPTEGRSQWWKMRRYEQVTVSLSRHQALLLARMVEDDEPVPKGQRPIVLHQLRMAYVGDLTSGSAALEPQTVDGLVQQAPTLIGTLCRQLGEGFMPAMPGEDLPQLCRYWIQKTRSSDHFQGVKKIKKIRDKMKSTST